MAPEPDAKAVDQHGTKVAYVLKYLQTLVEDSESTRIILFSQWQFMLDTLEQGLLELEIGCVVCKGNVFQRNKAIRQFYASETVRVIIISTANAAAGTNLTEASHVVITLITSNKPADKFDYNPNNPNLISIQ